MSERRVRDPWYKRIYWPYVFLGIASLVFIPMGFLYYVGVIMGELEPGYIFMGLVVHAIIIGSWVEEGVLFRTPSAALPWRCYRFGHKPGYPHPRFADLMRCARCDLTYAPGASGETRPE